MFSPRFGALLLFIASFVSVSAQKQEFEMFLTGKKIGTLTTDRKVKGDVEMYTLTSTASAQILWKDISTLTTYNIVFKGGNLSESYYEHKENGVVEKYCKISPAAAGYAIHHWKNGKFNVGSLADFCLISIYYNEPKDGQKLFNEGWGEFTTIKKTDTNEYEFKAPDGNKNIYRYSGGKISEAEFHSSLVTVRMKRKY